MGGSIIADSSVVKTVNSHDNESIDTFQSLAEVCSTAVRNPVGNVYAASQKSNGGWVVRAQLAKYSTRLIRSLVQAPSSFKDGYAVNHTGGTLPSFMHANISSNSCDISTNPIIPRWSSLRLSRVFINNSLYRPISWRSTTSNGVLCGPISLSVVS